MSAGFDSEQAMAFLQNLDEEQIDKAVTSVIENFLVPVANDIREEAQEQPSSEEIRQQLEDLPEEEKQEIFDETVTELIFAVSMFRQRPMEASKRLRSMIRDPHTMEALMLVFNDEPEVSPEKAEELKEFVTIQVRRAAVHVLPEIYTQEEMEEVAADLYPDVPPEKAKEMLEEQGVEWD